MGHVSASGELQAAPRAREHGKTSASARRSLRSRSIRVARVGRDERERAARRSLELEASLQRPRLRNECQNGPRPCPYVACRHHLYLDVSPSTGTIKLNFPDLEVWELAESCALDVAESGAQPLERTSTLLNVTRERVRQIEAVALAKLHAERSVQLLRD
ncbi:MAG TPA: sigma factor-like helix-turn-helix DNA-binding protein [Polyangiaceae bacterium]|nr:sigma factor-like helix-turn-helix DNA-binding protein [Polyangiaceae bacterium]